MENNAYSVNSARLNTHPVPVCTRNKDWKEPPECQLLLSLVSTRTGLLVLHIMYNKTSYFFLQDLIMLWVHLAPFLNQRLKLLNNGIRSLGQ